MSRSAAGLRRVDAPHGSDMSCDDIEYDWHLWWDIDSAQVWGQYSANKGERWLEL